MKAILEPSEPDEPLGIGDLLKMEESENLYRLYGYGLCKGNPPPKILPAISGAGFLHFWYLKLLVNLVLGGSGPQDVTLEVVNRVWLESRA